MKHDEQRCKVCGVLRRMRPGRLCGECRIRLRAAAKRGDLAARDLLERADYLASIATGRRHVQLMFDWGE